MKLSAAMPAFLVGIFSTTVDGHGLLTFPPSKNGGTVSIPHESSTDHFSVASFGIIDKAFFENDHSKTPWTRPGEFDYKSARDVVPSHPQTLHPCGCNAGGVAQCAGVMHASGFGETTQGNTLTPPTWAKGSTQETAWNAWVNHAGGHIYMLCAKTQFDSCRDEKLPANPLEATRDQQDAYLECVWDCFESNTLEWDTNEGDSWSQKLQFQDDQCTYTTTEPQYKEGKNGHLWRYTPIPDSLQVTNGGEGKCMWDSVTAFSNDKARDEFVASFGTQDVCDWGNDAHSPKNWNVFDKVKVPMDLEEGEYLLSWRWDAYTADQMWTSCADVTIGPTGGNDQSSSNSQDKCTTPTPPEETPTTTDAPKTPDNMPDTPCCPPGHNGMLAYNDCTQYYYCIHGQVVGSATACPPNTLFDNEMQYCNWASQVTCPGNANCST